MSSPPDEAAREEALALMQEQEARPVHVRHVARLAVVLFDELVSLHGMGPRERLMLETAGYLHDIGHKTAVKGEGHHKESARLIREHVWNSFLRREVEIIAQIARYHRKTMPEMEHPEFRALDEFDRRIVQSSASLLRLADSLDRTHCQLVTGIKVELPVNRLVFHLEVSGPVLREIRAAQVKGDLARAVFQRDLIFMIDGEEVHAPLDQPPLPGA